MMKGLLINVENQTFDPITYDPSLEGIMATLPMCKHVERVELSDKYAMYVDEEGECSGKWLPGARVRARSRKFYLYGYALVVRERPDTDTIDLTDEDVEFLRGYFADKHNFYFC